MPAPLTTPAPGDYPQQAWVRLGAALKAWRQTELGIRTVREFTELPGSVSKTVINYLEGGTPRLYEPTTWVRLTDQYQLAPGSMEEFLAGASELTKVPELRYRPVSLQELDAAIGTLDAAMGTLQRVRDQMTGAVVPMARLEDRRRAAG
jgi:hypothetical protein